MSSPTIPYFFLLAIFIWHSYTFHIWKCILDPEPPEHHHQQFPIFFLFFSYFIAIFTPENPSCLVLLDRNLICLFLSSLVHRNFIINPHLCSPAILNTCHRCLALGGIALPPLLGSMPSQRTLTSPLLMATCRACRAQHWQRLSPSIIIHSLRFFCVTK